jgi:hypothetical protein
MFGKAKSKAELQALKDDYFANLQVEIENSTILEKKIRKPDEAPPVPPQYKTEAELIADVSTLRNELVDMLMNELGYGYTVAQQALEGLDSDEILKLVALFPAFKLTIAKDTTRNRLRLLPPDFINSAMKNFIKKSGRSFGTEYSVGIPSSLEELEKMIPSSDKVLDLIDFLSADLDGVNIPTLLNQSSPTAYQTIIAYLNKYVNAYPSFAQLKQLKINIPSSSRGDLARELGQAMVDYKLLTDNDVDDIKQIVRETVRERDANDIAQLGEVVSSRLGGAYNSQIDQFKRVWDTALKTQGGKNMPRLAEIVERQPKTRIELGDLQDADIEFEDLMAELAGIQPIVRGGVEETKAPEKEPNIQMVIAEIANNTDDEDIVALAQGLMTDAKVREDLVRQMLEDTITNQGVDVNNLSKGQAENVIDTTHQKVQQALVDMGADEEDLSATFLYDIMSNPVGNYSVDPRSQSIARKRIEDRFRNQNVSLSVIDRYLETIKDAIKTRYGVEVDFPKYANRSGVKPSKSEPITALNKVVDRLIEDQLYDPDEKALLPDEKIGRQQLEGFGVRQKIRKGFHKMPDGKMMKDSDHMMGKGVKSTQPSVKSTQPSVKGRISVKKLVGRGIEVEQQPTYKKFGKYVMHYPHLVNNNVFNVKYPSLGSIPAIKPKTITDEYKEFVLDIFDSGKMNERLFNTLDDDEKTHFHKVCKGAGLLELFKLKKGDTDEERDDLDRFNLLKGSFVAGNNSESVVRELRSLITKFIHEGRITKNEGLSLLMEIK